MSRCKDAVIEMIDEAVQANYSRGVCECGKPGTNEDKCRYCKIKEALQMSRSCIISSVGRVAVMRANMEAVQDEIIRKIKEIVGRD